MNDVLLQFLTGLSAIVLAVLGEYARRLLKSKAVGHKLHTLRTLAADGVQMAEEMGHAFAIPSAEKLEQATDSLQSLANHFKIAVSDEEARRLVLSALTEYRNSTAFDFPDFFEPTTDAEAPPVDAPEGGGAGTIAPEVPTTEEL